MSEKIVLPDGKIRRRLIGQLLNNPKTCKWSLEMMAINKLLTKINDADFWDFFSKHHKFNSLLHLLPQTHLVSSSYFEYTKLHKLQVGSQKTEISQESKVGNDIIIEKKPKTLKDFIK